MTNYDTLKEYEAHKEPLPSYEEWKRLQEQLNEANKALAGTITPQTPSIEPVIKYLDKWGVK